MATNLQGLLRGSTPAAERMWLDLWKRLPASPAVCWYPSSGNCFRDLLIWRHCPALASVPEPDLFVHTDYVNDGRLLAGWQDNRTRIDILEDEELCFDRPVGYRVDPEFASLSGLAGESPRVRLLQVRVRCRSTGEHHHPVVYFHFENFNWFREVVLGFDVKITHLFKLREGCGFGGCRTSVSNLYPLLWQIGCRYLVADQEVHLQRSLLSRLLRLHGGDESIAFMLQHLGFLETLSGLDVHAWQLRAAPARTGWMERMFEAVTSDSPWGEDFDLSRGSDPSSRVLHRP